MWTQLSYSDVIALSRQQRPFSKTCTTGGCSREVYRTHLCALHYRRKLRGVPAYTEREKFILDNPPENGIGLLPLGNGLSTIVDEEDYYKLVGRGWALSHRGIVCWVSRGQHISIHREIMRAAPGMDVDHINHNRLDNRKCNLRVCTRSQNQMNRRKIKKGTSKYKGVRRHAQYDAWTASLSKNGKKYFLGCFKSEKDAAIMYNVAAQLFFGEFASLNPL